MPTANLTFVHPAKRPRAADTAGGTAQEELAPMQMQRVAEGSNVRSWRRNQRLRELGYGSYAEYLGSPQWQDVRRRYRASDHPQECICGETDGLQLHHLTYERIGAEELTDLTPLCGNCHAMIHALERRGEIGLDFAGFVDEQRASRNRVEQAKRRAEAKRLEQGEVARRERQRLRGQFRHREHKLRKLLSAAANLSVDISPELDEAIAAIGKKLHPEREAA